MDTQQMIALALVGVAAVYLGRQFVLSVRSFFSARSGCSSGCGKCAFAREASRQRPQTARKAGNIIPLIEVRTSPGDQSMERFQGDVR